MIVEALSISTSIAALIGGLVSISLIFLVPLLKNSSVIRVRAAYVTATLVVAIWLISFANLWQLDRGTSRPGNVTVDLPRQTASVDPALPERITTKQAISQTLESHQEVFGKTTRKYELSFPARQGFRIVEAKFMESNATRVSDFSVEIEDEGQRAVVRFKLTSGPAVDRFRGWLHGNLVLTQEQVFGS